MGEILILAFRDLLILYNVENQNMINNVNKRR